MPFIIPRIFETFYILLINRYLFIQAVYTDSRESGVSFIIVMIGIRQSAIERDNSLLFAKRIRSGCINSIPLFCNVIKHHNYNISLTNAGSITVELSEL